jgi:hypothetical protein
MERAFGQGLIKVCDGSSDRSIGSKLLQLALAGHPCTRLEHAALLTKLC